MLLPPTASRTTKHLVIMTLEVEQMVPNICVKLIGPDSEKEGNDENFNLAFLSGSNFYFFFIFEQH